MHPEILHLGFMHLRSYGLMMAVAFILLPPLWVLRSKDWIQGRA